MTRNAREARIGGGGWDRRRTDYKSTEYILALLRSYVCIMKIPSAVVLKIVGFGVGVGKTGFKFPTILETHWATLGQSHSHT